jgi:hypothetical protein
MKSLAIFATITLLGAAALLLSIDRSTPRAEQHAAGSSAPAEHASVRPGSTARLPELPRETHPEAGSAQPERTAESAITDRRAQLQAQFAGQAVDAGWAMQSRQQLRDDLGRYANADVRVRDIECRSSLCRIELASTNRAAQQSVVEDWVRHRTWTGSGFAVQDGDATIVYVSKPGVDLPGDVASAR